MAKKYSSFLNTAYEALRNPARRAEYMVSDATMFRDDFNMRSQLAKRGVDLDDERAKLDQNFLIQVRSNTAYYAEAKESLYHVFWM